MRECVARAKHRQAFVLVQMRRWSSEADAPKHEAKMLRVQVEKSAAAPLPLGNINKGALLATVRLGSALARKIPYYTGAIIEMTVLHCVLYSNTASARKPSPS